MKDFLTKILSSVVDLPEQARVEEFTENGYLVYLLSVPEAQIGKLIGKNGNVIRAIRILTRVKAVQEGKKVLIKISEPATQNGNGLSRPTTEGETDSPTSG